MASPIFPGVGTRSRIADVFQGQSQLDLQQEALNRQSGAQLLQLLTSTGLQTGDLINQIQQAQLGREAQASEGLAERSAALGRIQEGGVQDRLTDQATFDREGIAPEDEFDTQARVLRAQATTEATELVGGGQPDASGKFVPVTTGQIEDLAEQLFQAKLRNLAISNPESAALSATGRLVLQQLQGEGFGAGAPLGPGLQGPTQGFPAPAPGAPGVAPFGILPPQAPSSIAPPETDADRAAKRRLRTRSSIGESLQRAQSLQGGGGIF